jgi:hypothetical protein
MKRILTSFKRESEFCGVLEREREREGILTDWEL